LAEKVALYEKALAAIPEVEYVAVPDALLRKTRELGKYFAMS